MGTTAAMFRDIIKETTSDEICSELRVIFKHVKCKFNRRITRKQRLMLQYYPCLDAGKLVIVGMSFIS